jgi:hypothetical protein
MLALPFFLYDSEILEESPAVAIVLYTLLNLKRNESIFE